MRHAGVLALLALLAVAGPAGADHQWVPVLSIDAASLLALMQRGETVAPVDLRAETEFREGRLPGARSMPLATLEARAEELPRRGLVVLYCACPERSLHLAYQRLRARTHASVFILEGGLEGWQQAGGTLER